MTEEDCYNALRQLIKKFITDEAKRTALLLEIDELQKSGEIPPAKGILAEIQRHGKKTEWTEEDSNMVKDIYFNYG